MSAFISYRRKGGAELARKLYEELRIEYEVFLDEESLNSGRFDKAIESNLEKCTDFILIVTDSTFDRCSNDDDWITAESTCALKNKKNIIPIFLGVNAFPDNVPEVLKKLTLYNAINWDGENSISKLKSFLKSEKRYLLSVTWKDKKLTLDDKSVNELMNLYKDFMETGWKENRKVVLEFCDDEIEAASKEINENLCSLYSYDENQGETIAAKIALQILKRKKHEIESAIEHMLSQKGNWSDGYYYNYCKEKYNVECFETSTGVAKTNTIPFVWIEIIENMLLYRINGYPNDSKAFEEWILSIGDKQHKKPNVNTLISLDCVVYGKNKEEKWYFKSYVPEECRKLLEYNDCLFFDIPAELKISNILPDFYYNLGFCKINRGSEYDSIKDEERVFDITKYLFLKG